MAFVTLIDKSTFQNLVYHSITYIWKGEALDATISL